VKRDTSVLSLFLLLMVFLLPRATSAQIVLPKTFAAPDSGFSSNSAIDIQLHDGGVWFATDEGLSVTYDQGQTWQRFGSNTGLISEIVSAMYSDGERFWTATSHSRRYDGARYAYSDGISYSDDDGQSWTWIDLTDFHDIKHIEGPYTTIYDLTGYIDESLEANWVFLASWAGGFLASRDGGTTWRRFFPSTADSVQFYSGSSLSERNKGFSCVADSTRPDSLFVWTGTSGGIFQYIFAGPRNKAASPYIFDIAFCDDCVDSSFVFYAGNESFMRGLTTGRPYVSRFDDDGMPGSGVSALTYYRGRLLVGTIDPTTSRLTGLAYSDDRGDSFSDQGLSVPFASGGDDQISDFVSIGERLYMAAEGHGLYASTDTGLTWDQILVDSADAASLRNTANGLAALGDTLLVGTDTGLATLYLNAAGSIDSLGFFTFGEFDSSASYVSSTTIRRVRVQEYTNEDSGLVDSVVYWTINEPLTDDGVRMVARRHSDSTSWQHLQWRVKMYDIGFLGDTAIAISESGTWYSTDGTNPSQAFLIEQYYGGAPIDSLGNDIVTTMVARGDTVIFGSNRGHAISTDRGQTFAIHRVNTDPMIPDLVIGYTAAQDLWRGLTGDFIPAMALQFIGEGVPGRLWVSNRSTVEWPNVNAISVGESVPVDADGDVILPGGEVDHYEWQWEYANATTFAWNFAFYDSIVFAATDSGLLRFDPNPEGGWVESKIPLQDSLGVPLILDGMPVYGVAVEPPYLWVATSDRTIRIRLDDHDDQTPYMVIDSTTSPDEVYAFPVPFSHNLDGASGGRVDFHFVVDNPANATIESYDFAMNLVTTVIDNQHFPAGIYPTTGSYRPTWDGLRDSGERVAVGVYYFKVELSSGDSRWGKLAVIP